MESAAPKPGVTIGDGGFAGEEQGGAGSLAGEGGDGHGGSVVSVGGAPGTIELGIFPTFAADDEQASPADAVLAAISALSAGSHTLPIYERWDTLSGATGSPRAVTWQRLDQMIAPYRERNKNVALCIGVVDRSAAAWPVVEEVDSLASELAIERTIDEAFTRYAAQLSHLCFGYEVDRYLDAASEDEGARLLRLLEHAVGYARAHPLRSMRTAVGVAVTMAAASDPDRLAPLALGDEVVAVYDPLDDAGELREPASIASELDAVLDARPLGVGDEPMPLALFEVGFPSSADAGSNDQAQRTYYDALLGALEPRVDELSFVGIYGLGDRAAPACAAESASFGSAADAHAAARCSMGLRAESGEAKSAWASVVQALSRYAPP